MDLYLAILMIANKNGVVAYQYPDGTIIKNHIYILDKSIPINYKDYFINIGETTINRYEREAIQHTDYNIAWPGDNSYKILYTTNMKLKGIPIITHKVTQSIIGASVSTNAEIAVELKRLMLN